MTKEQIQTFSDVVTLLHDLNLSEHVIIIGSWASYMYQFIFQDQRYYPDLKTRDIDMLYPNIRRPNTPVDLTSGLKEIGFEPYFDRHNNTTRFFKGTDAELEFLVQEKGAGGATSYEIRPIGIRAEGLRDLDILTNNTMRINTPNGLDVIVPRPAAYVLHKLVINHKRLPLSKREKDLRSAEYLMQYISHDNYHMQDIHNIYNSLTIKQKRYIHDSISKFNEPALENILTAKETKMIDIHELDANGVLMAGTNTTNCSQNDIVVSTDIENDYEIE